MELCSWVHNVSRTLVEAPLINEKIIEHVPVGLVWARLGQAAGPGARPSLRRPWRGAAAHPGPPPSTPQHRVPVSAFLYTSTCGHWSHSQAGFAILAVFYTWPYSLWGGNIRDQYPFKAVWAVLVPDAGHDSSTPPLHAALFKFVIFMFLLIIQLSYSRQLIPTLLLHFTASCYSYLPENRRENDKNHWKKLTPPPCRPHVSLTSVSCVEYAAMAFFSFL